DDPARIRATFDLVFLTGWSPADNQQKPLRPGSAQMLLADALNETKDRT
ncbi:MAG: SAM-dependent methyltransferase, partial [Paracoccus sp. (in: a-proteobacteria)]